MKPLQIGTITLENNLILAPMAGVTDLPFRLLCKEQGAALLCSEMVSAKALAYGGRNKVNAGKAPEEWILGVTEKLLMTDPAERPFSIQLFGGEPEFLAEAASILAERPFDVLDFNMGCPVPKVVNNGEGSALMKEPRRAEACLKALVEASKKPVTVKIRKGFDEDSVNAVEIAKIAESVGVSAVAVHARTRRQQYEGKADWDIIRQVKEALSIPVIGNGDVKNGTTALAMQEETGCDGIMIGRAARGNPWIFRQIKQFAATGEELARPGLKAVKEMLLRHTRMLLEQKGEAIGIREIRKHAAWYTAGYPHSAQVRGMINQVKSYKELEELLKKILLLDNSPHIG